MQFRQTRTRQACEYYVLLISEYLKVYFKALFWKLDFGSPIFDPGPAVKFLGPIVPLLLSDVPVVVRNPIRIQSGPILPLVPTLRSDPSVDDGVEAVDSLWTKIPRQRLGQHPLGCLGSRKAHLWIKFLTSLVFQN